MYKIHNTYILKKNGRKGREWGGKTYFSLYGLQDTYKHNMSSLLSLTVWGGCVNPSVYSRLDISHLHVYLGWLPSIVCLDIYLICFIYLSFQTFISHLSALCGAEVRRRDPTTHPNWGLYCGREGPFPTPPPLYNSHFQFFISVNMTTTLDRMSCKSRLEKEGRKKKR